MDSIEELLPGLEEFLAGTLAGESLSSFAEDRRQFFLERLDIVKLPPSVPPREGRSLPPELLKDTEETSGIPACNTVSDFAATQREISRSFLDSATSLDYDADGSSIDKTVKVYDDIDQVDGLEPDGGRPRTASEATSGKSVNSTDDSEENGLYEVPMARPILTREDNSLSCGTDGSSLATMGSTEELPYDAQESTSTCPPRVPTPRLPRRDITISESGSRDSVAGDNKPPELPFRPPLPKRNEIYSRSDKSDRSETEKSIPSDPDLSGDGDSTSYESFEDDNDHPDSDMANTFQVKLPKKIQKKSKLKRSRKLRKSCSPSRWEMNVPFRKLDNIDISGELHHRGKLKWNRRIGAISNGCLVIYKPDKNARPSLVIPLAGYEASLSEREGRKGYEVKMVHQEDDPHTFSVDFKEWALHWIEHINGNSKKQPPAKYHTHLARSYSEGADSGPSTATDGSKNDLTGSNSNVSTEGGSEESCKDKAKRKKIMRIGSFAFRASQFLESISKKSASGRKPRHTSVPGFRHSSGDTPELSVCVVESSVSSSNSAGNLTKDLLSPASDSSGSVFSGSNRASSVPPTPSTIEWSSRKSWGLDYGNITHSGHLSIYSNFNKRCWGQRWCLVRQNMFECYKTETSQQCELCFLLQPCVLRHAVVGANSQNGLMILEAGKEKITVETFSKDELGQWVRVLYKETTNEGIPEGLEEFLNCSESIDEYASSDMNNFFPGRNLSSHDYEDPEETVAAAARLKAEIETASGSVMDERDETDNPVSQSSLISQDAVDTVQDILPLSSQCKQTTDSGFYSVKGANSDSDSDCENTSCVVRKIDCQYTPPTSSNSQSSNTSRTSRPSTKSTVDSFHSSRKVSSLSKTSAIESQPNQSASISSTRSRQSLPSSTSQRSKKLVHQSSDNAAHTPRSHHGGHVPSPSSNISSHIKPNSSVHPKKFDQQTRNSSSTSAVSKSGSSTSSSKTIISPSGEEYSVILKRSERTSVSHNSSTGLTILAGGSTSTYRISGQGDDDVFSESGKHASPSSLNHTTQEHGSSLGDSNNNSTISESTGQQNFSEGRTESMKSTNSKEVEKDNISHLLISFNTDKPPPLPNSPVPKLRGDKNKVPVSSHTDHKKVERDATSVRAVIPKKTERKPVSRSAPVTSKKEDRTSVVNSGGDSPASPTSDNITDLIGKPGTTPDEIVKVIDCLKAKQAENKRKRMAVHDKRQRVLSDEERLACEKEFAALEKVGESTDQNIRLLQNHLDTIQGQTIEAMKAAHAKQMAGSKKKGKQK